MKIPTVPQAFAEAQGILADRLGDLPGMIAKTLAIGGGPISGLVRAWCVQNPEDAARIVGAVAWVQAVRIKSGEAT